MHQSFVSTVHLPLLGDRWGDSVDNEHGTFSRAVNYEKALPLPLNIGGVGRGWVCFGYQ